MSSFFKKIGSAIGNGLKAVGKVVGKVAQTVAPILAIIPGVGTAFSLVAGLAGNLLGPQPDQTSGPIAAVQQPTNLTLQAAQPSILPVLALGAAAFLLLR